mgnify:CR=1 FL=1
MTKQFKAFISGLREANLKTKVKGITIEIKKVKNKFDAIVDGDKLDSYSSEKEAMAMAKEFIKQYKGK